MMKLSMLKKLAKHAINNFSVLFVFFETIKIQNYYVY
jgi:hypothetical protein